MKDIARFIVICLIVSIGFVGMLLLQVFVFYKDKDEKISISSKYSKSIQSEDKKIHKNSNENNSNKTSNVNKFVDEVKEGYNDAKSNEKNYNVYNFDDVLLMYSGRQKAGSVSAMIDRIIEDVDNDLYLNPNIVLENFDNVNNTEIVYEKSEEYKTKLEELRNKLSSDSEYNISFGYGVITDTIIISKI